VPAPLVRDPIYHQLNQALRSLLREGEFKVGDQFLTERQVSERFAVSRITANKALSNLVAEGVLEFKKGVGTFVRGGILDYDMSALVSFTSQAKAAGKKPTTRLLTLEPVAAKEAPPEVGPALRVGPDDRLWHMVRLRLAGGVPVIHEERYLVHALCPRLQRADAEGSLYAALTQRHGLEIGGADETIRAVAIRGAEAKHLDVGGGAAGLLVIATGFVARGVPLWWERTLYRGDLYEFRNRVGSLETARPAAGALREPSASDD
jgi:GntR family transcriptional regulator